MKKCFISKNYRNLGSAGDKAKTDIEEILKNLGYVNIGNRQTRAKNSLVASFKTLMSVLKGVRRLGKDDILVVQYPLKKYYDYVVSKAVSKGAKVITVIHDLGSFRRKKLTVEEEVARLNRSAAVIVHSPAMSGWLRERGVTVPLIELGLFDYLSDSIPAPHSGTVTGRPKLMYAGNVSPQANEWVYRLGEAEPEVDIVLYGGGFDRSRATSNLIEKGFIDADSLIAKAEGDYGVVWYDKSLDEISGPLGEYLPYCAPHKTSLYLRSGMPVIIWDKAALAEVVVKLGAGIAVPSLNGISKVLAGISAEDYAVMRKNAAKAAAHLAAGGFMADALRKAEKAALS